MGEYYEDRKCIKKLLEKILLTQKKAKEMKGKSCSASCTEPLGKYHNNTIPLILYCDCKPLSAEGVTICYDEKSQKEKFLCFLTFIFRVVDSKDECVVLELLKFKNHHQCFANKNNHVCTPCCQLNSEDVENLVPTCVCITFDISSFNGIQCLPAVCL